MEKRLSFNEFQSVKLVAQACNPLMMKRKHIEGKINKLVEEYQSYDNQIKALEAGIVGLTGLRVEQMVKKVQEAGKPAKYIPTDIVSYDVNNKQFVIDVPETSEPIEVQQMPEQGNDYDIDAQAPQEDAAEEPEVETANVETEETVF